MRFGEYDLMTVAAAGVQMTWDCEEHWLAKLYIPGLRTCYSPYRILVLRLPLLKSTAHPCSSRYLL